MAMSSPERPRAETWLYRNNVSLIAFTVVLISVPFFFARFVPATDLPQHLAQIRLFVDSLHGETHGLYSINWWGANSLVYVLLGIDWALFTPIVAGKALMIELAVGWVIAGFALANRKNRPAEMGLLAGLFVFTASFYWGFVNFLLGWPVFVAWYILVVDQPGARKPAGRVLTIFLLSVLLLFAHPLWLAVGLVVLGMYDIRHRVGRKGLSLQVAGALPTLVYGLIWYQHTSQQRMSLTFDTAPHWSSLPWERLNPAWILDASFGGLRGPTEGVILLGVVAWVVAALYTHRRHIRSVIDKDLLWSSVVLFALVLFAPDKFLNTILFASRWMPPAIVLFLIALPAPRLPDFGRLAFASLLMVVLSVSTALRWSEFDRFENAGLAESLNAVPSSSSVLGLDFVKESAAVCVSPFVQTAAYSQVMHGGRIGFSFAEHQSGIVATDSIGTWTPGLEWFAELVTFEDLARFDYALVNATEDVHRYLSKLSALHPLTTAGRWRLYKCTGNMEFKGSVFAPLEKSGDLPQSNQQTQRNRTLR